MRPGFMGDAAASLFDVFAGNRNRMAKLRTRNSKGTASRRRATPLRKFEVFVQGKNFLFEFDGESQPSTSNKCGFFTTIYVKARSAAAAEPGAVSCLRRDVELRQALRNIQGDSPILRVQKIAELASFEDCHLPRTGLCIYPERKSRKKRSKKSRNSS